VRGIVHSGWLILLSAFCWSRLSMVPPVVDLIKIGTSAALCALAAVFVLQIQGGVLGLLMAIAAGGMVYMVALRLTAAIPQDDVEMLSHNLGNSLPGPLAGLSLRVLQLIAPRRAIQTEAP
jgi:zinc transporter ZupT